jgi:peptidyl-dipeptidase A
VTEAIAIFFQRFSIHSEWLDDVMNVKLLNKEKEDSKYLFNLDQLVFSRWAQVMFRFEKELYANPDQDLNKLWWDLVEKYQ